MSAKIAQFPVPPNEQRRLEALRNYQILDTEPEKTFDDFARLAALVCEAPSAFVNLIDADRQWCKAAVGAEAGNVAREYAFCSHAILSSDVMVVPDAWRDERFRESPLVRGEPHIRFYAGAPMLTAEGDAIGSLCVTDQRPRQLDAGQLEALQILARQVVAQLELRRVSRELATALREVRLLHGLLPICAHCKNIRNDKGYWERVEDYVQAHSDADFTHSICPNCLEEVMVRAVKDHPRRALP